ncbi:MAG TPA: cell envelope integrity protein TolA [Deltaproteobacteria bacterium]|nr:MAG: protein TolA [Deltaproteobacteria bacterium GWA2_55_82]OGQ64078.1 MAG: protein TolA [Deltaproteobacteria bacterium RIFCSPLOWO2_02_FULL_55_12]OIJ74530.1 MAG: protein TolA [Deltaproteobacteria bacterium GWC2_55_46]HBG47193.1 cell envelope integrity protein TolA [Deltaproteobacteria bacterium]HCY10745.1 cell envelope integrity protein TolA [Deltaproteobacteria bacterium]
MNTPMKGFGRTVAGSAIFHAALISLAVFVFGSEAKRAFITPVYTVDLVQSPGPRAERTEKRAPKEIPARKEAAAKAPDEAASRAQAAPEKSAQTVKIKEKSPSVDQAVKSISDKLRNRKNDELVDGRVDDIRKKLQAEEERRKRLAKLKDEISSREAARVETKAAPPLPTQAREYGAGQRPNLESRYPAYYGVIKARVENNWVYPPGLKDRSISVIVSIRIARSGKILEAAVEKSSGNQAFDESLLSAVWKASPFPPLPVEFEGNYLETGLRFCPGCV